MNDKLPKIKKTISSFISDESGQISKQSLLSLGAILGSAVALDLLAEEAGAWHSSANPGHTNSISLAYTTGKITASHTHSDPAHGSAHSSG